tara:strand:+ start:627 stop:803 length:177 start_codon:yes stop_codon:yes gene_type:complete
MEVAIGIASAIGLFVIFKTFVTLAAFEHHKHNSQYRHEEARHNRLHDHKMHEDPRYFV